MSKTKEKEIISPFRKITRKHAMNDVAINMLKNNEPIEKICAYTGLTIKEVEDIKKNLK